MVTWRASRGARATRQGVWSGGGCSDWKDKVQVELSCSRPFHKNDNRFVEENHTSTSSGHRFFQPVMRLAEKQWQAHRLKRIYDDVAPPFDRLCRLSAFSPAVRQELHALRQTTNPMILREEIQTLIDRLSALPCAKEGQIEDVHLSLFTFPNKKAVSIQ